MPDHLKVQWCLFTTLCLLLLVGVGVLWITYTPIQTLPLLPGKNVHIRLVRPFPDSLTMRMRVADTRPATETVPPIGERILQKETMQLLLRVRHNGRNTFFTTPGPQSFNNQFRLVPQDGVELILDSVNNDITITICESSFPAGIRSDLFIDPPVTLKITPHGYYKFFWWFIFWPIYAVPLCIYLIELIIQTIRYKKSGHKAR